jgi:hypothetical protein
LNPSYCRLSPHRWATHTFGFDAEFGALSDISIDIWMIMENGARRAPQRLFSEGYQDLIAPLYFLVVVRAAGQAAQARVLILDEVLQSVDSAVRLADMELVVEEFRDWQLLVTVHDRHCRWSEAEKFGCGVLTLLSRLRCASCGQWVDRAGKAYACPCGETVVTPKAVPA